MRESRQQFGGSSEAQGNWRQELRAAFIKLVASFTDWITSHGQLLRSIKIGSPCDGKELADRALAGALRSAQGLKIQLYSSSWATRSEALVLQQLPVNHLIDMTVLFRTDVNVKQTAAVLERLTNLQDLTLKATNADALLPAMSALRSLTRLTLSMVASSHLLQQLPVQLRQLDLGVADSDHPIDLSHLTALTCLESSANQLTLASGSILPPSLVSVHACKYTTFQPLLSLSRLQQLVLVNGPVHGHQLQELHATLTCLTEVQLLFEDYPLAFDDTDIATLQALPLRSLRVWRRSSSCVVLRDAALCLGLLKQLEYLELGADPTQRELPLHCSVPELTERLAFLTALRVLKVGRVDYAGTPRDFHHHHWYTLVETVAALPNLVELVLHCATVLPGVTQLTRATQLTSLELPFCGVSPYDVAALSCTLTGLRHLDLCGNGDLGDETCVFISAMLKQLTFLSLSHTQLSDDGAMWLSKLKELNTLELIDTHVSRLLLEELGAT
eukprot:gene6728-6948_t